MTTETLTLADFLLARIAEDEADAREAAGDEAHQNWAFNQAGDLNEGYIVSQALRRIVECEAKRRIGDVILGALALPYADHPDYREEWRP